MKKTLSIAAKVLIFALVAWFVRGTLLSAWEQIGKTPLQLQPAWLMLSGGIYLIALLPAGWYWHHILKVLGQEAGLGETLQAYYLGHLGKYVPGKAMVIILRTGLIRSHRVDTTLAVVSVFYETLTMMAVGSFLAVGILAFRLRSEHTMIAVSIGFMLLAGLPTLPPIFRRLLRFMQLGRFSKVSRFQPAVEKGTGAFSAEHPPGLSGKMRLSPFPQTQDPKPKNPTSILQLADQLTYANVFIGWFAMLLLWGGMALSLWAVFQACGLDCPLSSHFADCTAAVSLSVVLGFLAFIPGGLGVRDMMLVFLLVHLLHIGEAPAAVASGLLRLVWLVAELIVFAILYPLRLKLRREATIQDPRPTP
jgi:glycosyltransferase 2 family protein